MKAKLVIITARKRVRAPSSAASTMPHAGLAAGLGELDDQDRVLRGERDQHDEADLGVDVEGEARRASSAASAPATPTATESSTGTGIVQLS